MSTPNRVVVAGILLTAVTLLTISSWTLQRQIHEFDALSLQAASRSPSTSSTAPNASREMIYIPDLGTVADPVVTLPTPTAECASTLVKLQRKPAMRFAKETPLQDVLDYIKTATRAAKDDQDLQIYIDPLALQEADKTLASPVTIDLVGLPLSTTLGLVLKQLGLLPADFRPRVQGNDLVDPDESGPHGMLKSTACEASIHSPF